MTADETDPATGTRSTRPEAPAEAAGDTPTGNPAQPRPTLPRGMGKLDRRAIDTVRVLAMDAVQKAGNDGVPTRVVSLPCWEWFAAQDRAYREQVLPPAVRARVSVEAGVPMGWQEFVGDAGRIVDPDGTGVLHTPAGDR